MHQRTCDDSRPRGAPALARGLMDARAGLQRAARSRKADVAASVVRSTYAAQRGVSASAGARPRDGGPIARASPRAANRPVRPPPHFLRRYAPSLRRGAARARRDDRARPAPEVARCAPTPGRRARQHSAATQDRSKGARVRPRVGLRVRSTPPPSQFARTSTSNPFSSTTAPRFRSSPMMAVARKLLPSLSPTFALSTFTVLTFTSFRFA